MRMSTALLLALVACGEAPPLEVEPVGTLADRVAWSKAEPADQIIVTTLPAEVATLPGGTWSLGPSTEGRIVAWHVRPGQLVKAGEALADLSSPELSALGARAADLEAAVARNQELVDARRRAVEAGVVPITELSSAEAALSTARAEAQAARLALGAHAGGGKTSGGLWVWRAPASGSVSDVRCGLDAVRPGDVCVTLVDPEAAALRVDVPERHLGVLAGPVEAVLHVADGTTAHFVEATRAPVVDPHTRARRFLLRPDGVVPLVGSAGRADLLAKAPEGTVIVPEAALTRVDGKLAVLVRKGDAGETTFVRRVGRVEGGVAVTGLAAGTEVATEGVFLLKSLAILGDGGEE